MKDDLNYSPSDCFDTYPFPDNFETNPDLAGTGELFYEARSKTMVLNDEGLTATYNRFHDPREKSPEFQKLRDLHDAMDRAVLEAYGWHDVARSARCEFLLDYEEEDDAEGGKNSKRKKPWRLRWPDDFRDEVLARLLELNEKRHQEELLAGKGAGGSGSSRRKTAPKKGGKLAAKPRAALFDDE